MYCAAQLVLPESVLQQTGLTVERVRQYERRHPEVRRATYKIPHRGYAGTSANYVLHLCQDRGLRRV